MFSKKTKNKKSGFTLVEVLVFSLIVVIVVLTFYRTFASGAKVLRDARARMTASQVANEQFEILRNIPYEKLLNVNSGGAIQHSQELIKSGIAFTVVTDIAYNDDVYDDVATGTDLRPQDYKQVSVTVSWKSSGETKKIILYSQFAPPGTEELYNGGILSVDIRQSDGTPVNGATVEVSNINTGQVLNTEETLADGKVYLIGYVPEDKKYKITVRKNGYYPVDTMPPYTGIANTYDPVDVHASVVLAGIWQKTIIFDPLASLSLRTEDPLGNSVGDIDFSLEGGRKMGDLAGASFYSFVKSLHNTNSSGNYTFSNESPGKYMFEYGTSANNSNYEFWKMQPFYENVKTNFFVNPNAVTDVKAIVVPKNVPSIFLKVVDKVDLTPLSDATVTVKNESLAYDQNQLTDKFGQVYFPKNDSTIIPLQNVEYSIKVQAAGYHDQDFNLTVNNLTKPDPDIKMEPL